HTGSFGNPCRRRGKSSRYIGGVGRLAFLGCAFRSGTFLCQAETTNYQRTECNGDPSCKHTHIDLLLFRNSSWANSSNCSELRACQVFCCLGHPETCGTARGPSARGFGVLGLRCPRLCGFLVVSRVLAKRRSPIGFKTR